MGKDLKGKELGIGYTQRKDGLYQARFNHHGKLYCIYDKKLKDLRQKVLDIQTQTNNVSENPLNTIILDDLFEQFYQTTIIPFAKANTIKSVKIDYNRCNSEIGELRVVDIKAANLQIKINQLMEDHYKPSTIIRSFKILRRIFDYAIDNDIISKNPCKNITLPNNQNIHQRVLTVEEQDKFIESIKGDFYYNILMVLLSTGLRIGEACALTWDDIDLENELIKINKTLITGSAVNNSTMFGEPKTHNSIREIPITDDVKGYLTNQLKQQKELRVKLGDKWRGKGEFSNLVFTTRYGSPIIHKVILTHINNIVNNINYLELIQAKVEKRDPIYFSSISPHVLRRSFATRCFEQGLKPKNVQKILGHSSIQTTLDIYVHVIGDELKNDLQKFKIQSNCVTSV